MPEDDGSPVAGDATDLQAFDLDLTGQGDGGHALAGLAARAFGAVDPDDVPQVLAALARALHPSDTPVFRITFRRTGAAGAGQVTARGQVLFRHADGMARPCRLLGTIEPVAGTAAELTAELARARHEWETLRLAVDATRLGIWDWNPITGQLIWSAQMRVLFGLAPDEPITYARYVASLHPADRDAVLGVIGRAGEMGGQGSHYQVEHRVVWPDGTVRWVAGTGQAYFALVDGVMRPVRYVGTSRDVTDRRQAEEGLQQALQEKVTLLREVHHRVKNNLQVVSSLLSLEAARASRDAAQQMQRVAQRVRVMANVHEQLYRSEDFARIDLLKHLRDLCDGLQRLTGKPAVLLQVEGEPVVVDIETAIPFGLIANELVSNSLQHGFPGTRAGHIWVSLTRLHDGGFQLSVEDDGAGMAGPQEGGRAPLGLKLVEALTRQLDATIISEPARYGQGTCVRLSRVPRDGPPG